MPIVSDDYKNWQSPINLSESKADIIHLNHLDVGRVFHEKTDTKICNNGHYVQATLTRPGTISGGPLQHTYVLKNVHFHRGFCKTDGTDHAFNNHKLAMEAHFVFSYSYQIPIPMDLLEMGRSIEEKKKLISGRVSDESLRREVLEEEEYFATYEDGVIEERWQREKSRVLVENRKATAYTPWATTLSSSAVNISNGQGEAEVEGTSATSIETPFGSDEALGEHTNLDPNLQKRLEISAIEKLVKKNKEKAVHRKAIKEYTRFASVDEKSEAVMRDIQEKEPSLSADNIPRTAREIELERQKNNEELAKKLESWKKYRGNDLKNITEKNVELLCVIGILFEENNSLAPNYNLFTYLSHVREPFTEYLVTGNLLHDFKPGLVSPNYFVYHGSLTTPPFSPGIEWIVKEERMFISTSQLNYLRAIKNEFKTIVPNVRALQDIGTRKIYLCKPEEKRSPEEAPVCLGKEYCSCLDSIPPRAPWLDTQKRFLVLENDGDIFWPYTHCNYRAHSVQDFLWNNKELFHDFPSGIKNRGMKKKIWSGQDPSSIVDNLTPTPGSGRTAEERTRADHPE